MFISFTGLTEQRKMIVELDCHIDQFGWRSGEVLA